jgi:hypothetical protein
LTQSDEILGNFLENAFVSLLIFKLKDILYKVIPIGVFYQVFHMFNDEIGKLQLLRLGALLKASLHHTAAVLVHANFDTVLHTSVKDKLSVLAGHLASSQVLVGWVVRGSKDHQKGLNDVVAMHVHGELDDFSI